MKMEVEIELKYLQTKECQGLPAPLGGREMGGMILSCRFQTQHGPVNILISDFGPPEL